MARDHQLKISIERDLAEKFKTHCIVSNISMAERLTQMIDTEIGTKPVLNQRVLKIESRKQRREAIQKIASLVEAIKDREEVYRDRIPESLKCGAGYEAAEQAIDALDQAVCLLNDAF